MAIYDNLPVYKTSYDLLVAIFGLARNFQRDYRYTLGEKLKEEMVALITNIYRANSRRDKGPLIEKARENIEVTRLYLRLLKDLKQVSLPKFVELNRKVEDVSKQLAGWGKYSDGRRRNGGR